MLPLFRSKRLFELPDNGFPFNAGCQIAAISGNCDAADVAWNFLKQLTMLAIPNLAPAGFQSGHDSLDQVFTIRRIA